MEFEDAFTTPQVKACIHHIETAVRDEHPDVVALFVKPETPQTWQDYVDALVAGK